MTNDQLIKITAIDTLKSLLETHHILTTAESCTGGWIAKAITDLPGSSAAFDRGFITYSNEAKMEMLGVRAQTLKTHGAVSKQTVVEMAEGALKNSKASIAVSVSGIAGPDGGTTDKPVGIVWIAWTMTGQPTKTEKHQFKGDRETIRIQAVIAALSTLARQLD